MNIFLIYLLITCYNINAINFPIKNKFFRLPFNNNNNPIYNNNNNNNNNNPIYNNLFSEIELKNVTSEKELELNNGICSLIFCKDLTKVNIFNILLYNNIDIDDVILIYTMNLSKDLSVDKELFSGTLVKENTGLVLCD